MLSRKKSFLLNAAVITLLISGSHTTFAAVSEKNPQVTEAQKAADKAREDRLAEMKAAIGKRTEGEATPGIKASSELENKAAEEPKPTPMAKPHATHSLPHAASSDKPVHRHRTLQEQIALNNQKKAEELHKLHEMNKGKAAEGSTKPMTWQERAKLAREKREAAMKGSVAEHHKAGETTHPTVNLANPSLKMTTEEHEHTVTTLPMPSKTKSQAEHHKAEETTHPTVNLTNPPVQMHIEEHEEITLPMPKKEEAKPVTQEADTKAEPAKVNPAKGDLLAQIREGKALKKTTPPAPSN
jgi:hypothetical protein